MGGVQTKQNSFLTSSLGGGEWSASRPDRFTPGKELRYPLNRWLAEPQSQSGHFAAQTELVCARIRNPNGPARSVVIVDCDYATSAASRSHFQGSSSRGVKVSRSRMSGVTVPLPPCMDRAKFALNAAHEHTEHTMPLPRTNVHTS